MAAITRTEERAEDFKQQGIQPVVWDLADPSASTLPPADTVLWAVGFDRSAGSSREQIWLRGLESLIRSLSCAPRRFIYISSTSVYGHRGGDVVDEDSPPQPTTEGGICCLQAEQLARSECQRLYPDTQVVVLRLAGIYGPQRLLRRVSLLKEQQSLPGAPDHWLNLIHVSDAVRMIDYVASADEVPDLINVVNSETLTRRQYYTQLAECISAPPPIFDGAARSGRPVSGNRRVTSQHVDLSASAMLKYDDVRQGLSQAVRETQFDA